MPFDVAVDSNDNVYVADSGNDRIQKFDSDSNFITQWGGDVDDKGLFLKLSLLILRERCM